MQRFGGARRCAGAVLLAGVLVAGCGGSDSDEASGAGGTIRMVGFASGVSGEQSPLARLVREFEKANPDVKVEFTTLPATEYDETIRAQINAGSPPDVMQNIAGSGANTALANLGKANALTDLSNEPWADTIPEQFRSVMGNDGRILGFSPTRSAIGLIHDRKAFAAAGMEVPDSFTDMIDLCRQASDAGKVLIALGGQDTVNLIFLGYAMAASTAYAENPDFPEQRLAGEVTFSDSAGWKQALEQINEMDDANCFGETPTGVSSGVAEQRLNRGDALATVAVLERLPVVKAAAPDGDWAVAPFPGNADPALVRVPVGVSAAFSVPAKGDNPELARRFVAYVADPEVARRYATDSQSVPLVVEDEAAPPPVPEGAEDLAPYFASDKSVTYLDQNWPNPQVGVSFQTGVQAMLSGQMSPDEVLAGMDEAWQAG